MAVASRSMPRRRPSPPCRASVLLTHPKRTRLIDEATRQRLRERMLARWKARDDLGDEL